MQKIISVLLLLLITSGSSFASFVPEAGFADIVEPLMPAVVNVYTAQYPKNKGKKPAEAKRAPHGFPFNQFNSLIERLEVPFGLEEIYSNPQAVSLGSGFVIDETGYIVTNHHVIEGADEIYIKLSDNKEIQAKLIGSDVRTDLALLKVESKTPLPFVKFGSSRDARVGDWVIVIGNPFGLGGTVTAGIISSKSRDISDSGIVDDFIQTDAAINTGNSGGPMFNIRGEVIGINKVIFSPSGTNIGIGFAIPSATAQSIIKQLKEHGKVSRGFLSIHIQEISPELAEGFGLPEATEGVLVFDVEPGGTGEAAGLKPGDVITAFGGVSIKNSRKLQIAVAEAVVNTDVTITILRAGVSMDLTCRITDVDKKHQATQVKEREDKNLAASESIEKHGVVFSALTQDLAYKFGLKSSMQALVVSDVSDDSRLWKGLARGDLIMAMNQVSITTVDDFKRVYEEALQAKRKNLVMLVKRHNVTLFVALPLE